jgi:hypothetical protein
MEKRGEGGERSERGKARGEQRAAGRSEATGGRTCAIMQYTFDFFKPVLLSLTITRSPSPPSKTAVLDMDLLSFLLDIAQPSSIVARTVTRKSSVLPIFTKMSQENWDGKKVEKTQSGLLVPTGVEVSERDVTSKVMGVDSYYRRITNQVAI